MCGRRRSAVDRLLKLRDERVEHGGGLGVAKEGGVEEVATLEDGVGVLLLDERI